jgi:hypothetical protein
MVYGFLSSIREEGGRGETKVSLISEFKRTAREQGRSRSHDVGAQADDLKNRILPTFDFENGNFVDQIL